MFHEPLVLVVPRLRSGQVVLVICCFFCCLVTARLARVGRCLTNYRRKRPATLFPLPVTARLGRVGRCLSSGDTIPNSGRSSGRCVWAVGLAERRRAGLAGRDDAVQDSVIGATAAHLRTDGSECRLREEKQLRFRPFGAGFSVVRPPGGSGSPIALQGDWGAPHAAG